MRIGITSDAIFKVKKTEWLIIIILNYHLNYMKVASILDMRRMQE